MEKAVHVSKKASTKESLHIPNVRKNQDRDSFSYPYLSFGYMQAFARKP